MHSRGRKSRAAMDGVHPALQHLDHRPWPLPRGAWRWRQSWLNLAFIHYRVEAWQLEQLLPPGLQLQQFDGSAWVGLVPFQMAGVMRRPLPDLPYVSSFQELNLRTYVERDGKPGVWFFSLDASSWPMVWGGRWVYGLPYFAARMRLVADGDAYEFFSERRAGRARFAARYRGIGEMFQARAGSFEHWATERYCLYSARSRSRIERVEVHHRPWPLQRAQVEIRENGMLTASGLVPQADGEGPVVHFSPGVQVVSFGSEQG